MFVTEDGSAIRDDGSVILFSIERFVRDIVEGDCCFLCGRSPKDVFFNDEHVIPDWVLRLANLHGQRITLPNETLFKYAQYKIPCCKDCNDTMGRDLEVPISSLFAKGPAAVAQHMQTVEGMTQIFIWLTFIFVKTHLKDRLLREHQDRRMPEENIDQRYEWEPVLSANGVRATW